ncbi:MAG: ABC transporter permease [Chloroflexi bacterium RBG_16_58_14]|nr:MAG: ABC transporter permease [Chloroflexi bacterium RBG_16_58_14]
MTGYLLRRLLQMVLIVFLSATVCYALLNLAPGGPLSGLRQIQQSATFQITQEDIERIRSYYELDLYLPIRFSRWLIGFPTGPIIVGNNEFFPNNPVGCTSPIEQEVENEAGEFKSVITGCNQYVYLRDLAARRQSNGVLFGDFGASWRLNRDRPVSDLIVGRLPKTLQLMVLALTISLLLGVPLGIISAVRQYSRFDYAVTSFAFFGSAMPTFFFGLILILLFSIIPKGYNLPYLPPGSSEAVRDYIVPWVGKINAGSAMDRGMHLILPAAVLSMAYVAGWSRFVRASMLDVLRQDYVRTARAKGLMERVVIVKHALRNALIPFVTVVAFAIPTLFAGAIITESIFSWPGMGRLYILALGEYDYPVAMALLFIEAILVVVATLLQDVLYTVVDPRIRFS